MSRSRKALAAAAMAIAAAGGGLLITAAGAVPAYAATQVPPPGGHPGGHVVATVTFQRAAPAASGSGSGPSVILPCAVHSPGAAAGAAPADDTCDSGIITCDVTAALPHHALNGQLVFSAETYCSDDVAQIRMGQDVIHSTPIDPNNPLTDSSIIDDLLILSERLKNSTAGLLHKCGFVYMLAGFHAGGGVSVPAERTSAIPRPVSPDPNLRG